MAETFRAPGAQVPYIHGVSPEGKIRQLPYGRNITSGMTEMAGGRIVLTRAAEAKGWITLEQAYKDDPSAKKKAKGLIIYKDWEQAALHKRAPRFRVKKGDGSERPATKDFPEHLLPAEVIARRNGTSSVSVQEWEAPMLDDEPTAELEIDETPKAKRGKAKA